MDEKKFQTENLNIPSEKDSLEAQFSKELGERFKDNDKTSNRDFEFCVSGLSGAESQPLDEIISTIDGEVEENYGQVVMADFGTDRREAAKGKEQYIVFTLNDTRYAVPMTNVIEIGRFVNITSVPNLPVWLRGITNIRGDIMSVIDLGLFLGTDHVAQLDSSIMLVVRSAGDEISTALIVDGVSGILSASKSVIVTTTAPIDDKMAPFLSGLFEHEGHLLMVLDLEKFLRLPEVRKFQ
ncbi:MAG: chemotaxis protein CheW [Thermodesulfobacteriota bacterium]